MFVGLDFCFFFFFQCALHSQAAATRRYAQTANLPTVVGGASLIVRMIFVAIAPLVTINPLTTPLVSSVATMVPITGALQGRLRLVRPVVGKISSMRKILRLVRPALSDTTAREA